MPNREYDKPLKPRLYLAAPLFSDAERSFNVVIRDALSQYFRVYLPQEDGHLLVDMVEEGWAPGAAATAVFLADLKALDDCNVFFIILDGRSVDEGAAFELGYAFAGRKPCYALRTDPRQLLATGNNPMIEQALEAIFGSVAEVVEWGERFCSPKDEADAPRAEQEQEPHAICLP